MQTGLSNHKNEDPGKGSLKEPWPESLREFYELALGRLHVRKAILREWLWGCLEHIRKSFEQNKETAIRELVAEHQRDKDDLERRATEAEKRALAIAHYFERLVAELTEENRRDPMTGLYNLPALMTRAEADFVAPNLGRWGALGVVDVRDFKWFNDNLGHHVGDEVIKVVARVLMEKTRHEPGRTDDLCVRRSGDEFIFLFWNLNNTEEGYELAQRFKQGVRVVDLTESIGQEAAARIRDEHPIEVDVGVVFLRVGNRPEDVPMRRQYAHKIVFNWLMQADKVMYWAKTEKAAVVYRIRAFIDEGGNIVEFAQEQVGE